jgi:hypothetical protein
MTLRNNPITSILFGIFLLYLSTESFLHVYDYELTYFSLFLSIHLIAYIGNTFGYEALGIFFFISASILLYSGISQLVIINRNKITKCPNCNRYIEYVYNYEEIPYTKKCKYCGHEF